MKERIGEMNMVSPQPQINPYGFIRTCVQLKRESHHSRQSENELKFQSRDIENGVDQNKQIPVIAEI